MSEDAPQIPSAAEAAAHPVLWAMRASEGTWDPGPANSHFWFFGDVALDLFSGKEKRVCIALPPRHGKSTFWDTYFTTWILGRRPTAEVLVCAYAEKLALGWSDDAKRALAVHGPEVFGLTANRRSSAAEWFTLDHLTGERAGIGVKGAYRAVGVGGVVTGRGADVGLCDDLYRDSKEADSVAIREQRWEFFVSAFLSRLSPDGVAIVPMTRWHNDDVVGRLMKLQEEELAKPESNWIPWRFINLPAIAEGDDPLGRAEGEPLWPDRFPLKHLLGIKDGPGGPRNWQCLYQGQPTGDQGDMFRREWFNTFVEQAGTLVGATTVSKRENLAIFATLDLAFSTKNRADYTVCCTWGADLQQGLLYLLKVRRERVRAENLAQWIRAEFDAEGVRRGYVERSGFYADITRFLITGARLPLAEIQPNADKQSRAQPAAALMASGRLLMRANAPWLPGLEAELLEFPAGKHDDQVDAISNGVLAFNEAGGSSPRRRAPSHPRPTQPTPGIDPHGRPYHVGLR